MAHDSFEEDIELANGHPIRLYRNTPTMAERTLLRISEERDKYKEALVNILESAANDGLYKIVTMVENALKE